MRRFGQVEIELAKLGHMVLSKKWFVHALGGLAIVMAFGQWDVLAQAQKPSTISESDLARQNMEHVAASSGQLFAVFRADPGLMVELKRWIAKDATAHGQVIADADLSEEAIFARLEDDVAFRSVATALVQKYGYLEPEVNPNSMLAKQQELLMRERVRYLAQDEELNRSRSGQGQQKTAAQQGEACDPATGECKAGNGANPNEQQNEQQHGILELPGQIPGLEPTPNLPSEPTPPLAPPAQSSPLLRTSGEDEFSMGGGTGALEGGSEEGGAPNFSQPGAGIGSADGRQLGADRQNDLALSSDFSSNRYGDGESISQNAASTERMSLSNPNGPAEGTGAATVQDARLLQGGRNQGLVRRADPYRYIPSLYDMYLQATPRPAEVRRFGMQIFENGTRDLQMIPMDLPAGPDYVLGPGDMISVDLWGSVSKRFPVRVDREGRISLPEVGPVLVAGKSLADVQQLVQKTLRTQFNEVSVDVSLARLRTIRIYVVGDVMRPGAYDVGSLSTPLNALFAAGGPTARGSLRIVKHNRGNDLVQDVDLYDLLLRGVKGNLERLENGDTVIVTPLGPEITIEGMVRRPAIYELKDEKSLADALALAGGLLPTALLRHIEVQRLVAHQKQTMLDMEIPADDSSEETTRKLESFQIQDGDKIRIYPIASYVQDVVYLEGHVLRPGKYSFREGMKLTDLIGSYKDLLPEPASQYGEIVRLRAPDFRPTVESFNLGDALADPAKAPVLHALDTVQIFERYDFEDPPAVSILGDVRSPGTYRTSGDIHLSDAIHLAGGLSPDAQETDAQVFRYMPDSTMKIVNVNLGGDAYWKFKRKHHAEASRSRAGTQKRGCNGSGDCVYQGSGGASGTLSTYIGHAHIGLNSKCGGIEAERGHEDGRPDALLMGRRKGGERKRPTGFAGKCAGGQSGERSGVGQRGCSGGTGATELERPGRDGYDSWRSCASRRLWNTAWRAAKFGAAAGGRIRARSLSVWRGLTARGSAEGGTAILWRTCAASTRAASEPKVDGGEFDRSGSAAVGGIGFCAMANHARQPDHDAADGPSDYTDFHEYQELAGHGARYHDAVGRCAGYSETAKLRDGTGPGVWADGGGIPPGQERALVSAASRWTH